jgi:hypothetical protein
MGYNTVAVFMNDTIDMVADDNEFGKRLYDATLEASGRRKKVDVPAHSARRGIACNAATILSCRHADDPQVVVVKQNTGYVYNYKETLPDHVIEDLKFVLEEHGYRISKKPRPKY